MRERSPGLNRKAPGYQPVSDFFDSSYHWWPQIYDEDGRHGFLGFEMRRRRDAVIDLLRSRQQGPCQLLDCGCGPGGVLREIRSPSITITGVDIKRDYLVQARGLLGGRSRLVQADLERLPFPDRQFDAIFCVGVLSYLQKEPAAMREMHRVLKRGGFVILSLPNLYRINFLFDPYYYVVGIIGYFMKKRRAGGSGFQKHMIKRYSLAKFRRLYGIDQGFSEKEMVCIGFGPFTFWRKDWVSVERSGRISDFLERISRKRAFFFLRLLANHWVVCLHKA
jgi:ubiquinone/menaquinone biosynthesis C-methylase UbiE